MGPTSRESYTNPCTFLAAVMCSAHGLSWQTRARFPTLTYEHSLITRDSYPHTLGGGLSSRTSGSLELATIHSAAEGSIQVDSFSIACCARSRLSFSSCRSFLIIGS